MENKNYLELPQEKFEFANTGETQLTDKKLVTKSMSYFADAFLRFRKNKASVFAAIIILLIVLFALIIPLIFRGPHVKVMDTYYSKNPGRFVWTKENIGIFDGGANEDLNQRDMVRLYAIAYGAEVDPNSPTGLGVAFESEYQPVIKVNSISQVSQGKDTNTVYNTRVDQYLKVGFIYKSFTPAEIQAIEEWEAATGKKIFYPMIDTESDYAFIPSNVTDANYWYKAKKGARPVTTAINSFGNEIATEIKLTDDLTDIVLEDNYLRDAEGNLVYRINQSSDNGEMYKTRILYYNYFQFMHGTTPEYLLGTDSQGYDLAVRMAEGIQLSLLLSVCVSVINFIIGAFYGSTAGYNGGTVDLVMERITDILSGIPFIIVATLFQQHLVNKGLAGPVESLIFAFVLTGWIGTASRVRTQFYRFKNQEYVMAARTLGASDTRIIWKHIFPNTLGTIITSSVLVIPGVIFSESMLSFLGIVSLGSAEGTSLGTLLSDARNLWQQHPHLLWCPAVVISLLMICFNLFGNGLRDAFNPSLRGVEE